MLNTVAVFFMGYLIGYFFGQQREKEKIKNANLPKQGNFDNKN